MKLITSIGVATAGIILCSSVIGAKPAAAAFVGVYDPSNWTLTNINADGAVNTTGSPEQIQLTGGDNSTARSGATDYTVKAAADGVLRFNWNYTTEDLAALFDPFNFVKNGAISNIFSGASAIGQGTYTTTVATGDVFGFRVQTEDNSLGRASVTISDFSAPVPEPFTISGSVVALGFAWWMKRKQVVSSKA